MSKKFEILGKPPEAQKKSKFEIHKEPTTKKGMKIEGAQRQSLLPGTEREINLAFQKNAYDCGPCLVININNLLNNASELSSVHRVRRKNNELIGRNENDTHWFTNIEIMQLLIDQNLDVITSRVEKSEDLSYIKGVIVNLMRENKEFAVYTSSGRHYKAVYHQDSNNIFLIDSLASDEQATKKDAQYISNFLQGATNTGRQEVIGVVRKKEETLE